MEHKSSHFRMKPTFWQCLLVTLAVVGVLSGLAQVMALGILGAVGASSISASCVIAFALPNARVGRSRTMIISYIVATLVGAACYALMHFMMGYVQISLNHASEIWGAIAVGITMGLMVRFDFLHPPAAGLALGLVLDQWNLPTILVILGSIIVIAIIKRLIRPVLHNLEWV